MFILKSAAKNIYRNKSKYIMFGILYLILILAASVCVNIFIQMRKVTDNILIEYAGVAKFDSYRFEEDMFDPVDRMTKEKYLDFKNIEHIDDIRFLKYKFYTDFLKENVPKLEVTAGGAVVNAPVFVFGYNLSLLQLVPEEFDLESGRMFENDGECVISKNRTATDEASIAWNKTELGGIITIKNNDGIHKQFTVVGIQKQNEKDEPNSNRRMIYTTLENAEYFEAVAPIKPSSYDIAPWYITDDFKIYPDDERYDDFEKNTISMGYEALAYLDSPETFLNLASELSRIKRNGLYFWLLPFFENFRPLINMTKVLWESATAFSVIITFVIICVAVVTTIILLNSRKYEMAVLLSIGMKKSRLIINYLIENLIFIWSITAVSLTAAQFIGPLFTNRVFEGMQSMVSAEMFKTLIRGANIELLLQNIAFVFGGMTLIVVFSLVITCVSIVRFEPMKIFNKQYS